jgi:xanthine/CO dehydrogenase XdhC/CoxF family maturation factor
VVSGSVSGGCVEVDLMVRTQAAWQPAAGPALPSVLVYGVSQEEAARFGQAARKQSLAEHFKLQPAELERLHGPVGLALGGKSPGEIAVSIVDEMVQMKGAAVVAAPAVMSEAGSA